MVSSRYHGQPKCDYFQVQAANSKYVLVVCATQSTVAKAFTVSQSRPVGKIRCLDRLAPLHLDEPNAHNCCVATAPKPFLLFPQQPSGPGTTLHRTRACFNTRP